MNGGVMPIATYPHIIEALRATAKPNPKDRAAFRELASTMELAESSLGNLLNPYADRDVVKVGLEQAMHIMKHRKDYSALRLIAAECGFTMIPLYSPPDKPTPQDEMLDDYQDFAAYQQAWRDGEPQPDRVMKLARVFDNMVQTEASIREAQGQKYEVGKGWANVKGVGQ